MNKAVHAFCTYYCLHIFNLGLPNVQSVLLVISTTFCLYKTLLQWYEQYIFTSCLVLKSVSVISFLEQFLNCWLLEEYSSDLVSSMGQTLKTMALIFPIIKFSNFTPPGFLFWMCSLEDQTEIATPLKSFSQIGQLKTTEDIQQFSQGD